MKTTKQSLKRDILKKRDMLSAAEAQRMSEIIFEKVFKEQCYINSDNILIYNSFNNEVCTKRAISTMLGQKNVYLPRINAADNLEAVKISVNCEYAQNKFKIFEPCGSACRDDILQLAIVPGVVFDKMGGRTGYGKAYYDIFLRGKNIYKLAVCYDFQIVNAIPTDLLDVNMDCIITEKNIYRIKEWGSK